MTRVCNGWAMLAAAIIDSGKRCNDESFLKSKWCEQLKALVRLELEERERKQDEYKIRIE